MAAERGMDARREAGLLLFFQAEDGIRDLTVTGVQTCALPIFALIAVLLIPTGIEMANAYHHDGLSACLTQTTSSACNQAVEGFTQRFRGLGNLLEIGRARLNSSHSQISYAVFCLKKKIEHTRG